MIRWLSSLMSNTSINRSEEMADSSVDSEQVPWNGLQLNGIMFPEPILEIILSKVPTKDILLLKKVCRIWDHITKRIAFWKLHYEHNEINWSLIPEYVKEKENGWLVMYTHANTNLLTTNFIKNHSGSAGFEHWHILEDGGHKIKIEGPPVGCDPLPEDEMFPDSNICFSTSFGVSALAQTIDLWKNGVNPRVMSTLLPFRIEVTERYSARFDCGGVYHVKVRAEDKNKSLLFAKKRNINVPSTMEWHRAQINFDFQAGLSTSVVKNLRYLKFTHAGKDNQFWAGNYGTKMAHACIRIIPLGDQSNIQFASDGEVEDPENEIRHRRGFQFGFQ